MKQEQLLEAIGGVDEGMLMETEQPARTVRFGIGKALLIAAVIAALAVSAGAVKGIFSLPIRDSQITTNETAAPFIMDSEGNIVPIPVKGLQITMDVDISENAPEYLEEYYLMDAPEGWQGSGMGTQAGRYWLSSWEQFFWQDSYSGRVELRQSTVHNYRSNEKTVDTLHWLLETDGVTAQTVQMAGMEVLKVSIPAIPWRNNSTAHAYCPQGETRLYWSDGRYIMRMIYPAGFTDAQGEAMLKTLHTEKVILNVPENYGKVDVQLLQELKPLFDLKPGTNTVDNAQMEQGRIALYKDKLYIGDTDKIIVYDLKTGKQHSYTLADKFADPKYLFVTDHYVGYLSHQDRLELLKLDGTAPETQVYEGIFSPQLYADGMTLYALGDGLRTIDLSTGEITKLAQKVTAYDLEGDTIYAIENNGWYFLKGKKGSTEFEKIELDFYPIRILAEGEDLYFSASEENGKYPVIRYRDGEITRLPMNAWMFQIMDGKLIYLDQQDKKYPVKSYDLETGETVTLMENVFEFSILQERYICCTIYNDGYAVLDQQTGEILRIRN